MFEKIFELPGSFFVALATVVIAIAFAWSGRWKGWGAPLAAVLATVSVWYGVDVFYNDYTVYRESIGDQHLDAAFGQIALFVVALVVMTPVFFELLTSRIANRTSMVMYYMESDGIWAPQFQLSISRFFAGLSTCWLLLMSFALYLVNGNIVGLFFPYFGVRANPWARNRIGGGIDSILAFALNLHIFLAAALGVVVALAVNGRVRRLAIIVCFLTFPFFVFDRTRNVMLAIVLPGLLTWVFVRLRSSYLTKAVVLVIAFAVVNVWFSFVLASRTKGSIASIFAKQAIGGEFDEFESPKRHLGLNMLEELGWINYFIEAGVYVPNGGERYFAELVNPIPRVLWPNKPMIGIDYSIARGQAGGSDDAAGVYATISTGMIGQGVVNFGPFFGTLAAAALMALWVSVLGRFDLTSSSPERLLLYACGIVLTFNMGRDITLLVIYPFLFGWALLAVVDRYSRPMLVNKRE
jgi:hypothetical protein